MLADWMFKHEVPTPYLWMGSFCVIVGFVAVSLQPTAPATTAHVPTPEHGAAAGAVSGGDGGGDDFGALVDTDDVIVCKVPIMEETMETPLPQQGTHVTPRRSPKTSSTLTVS